MRKEDASDFSSALSFTVRSSQSQGKLVNACGARLHSAEPYSFVFTLSQTFFDAEAVLESYVDGKGKYTGITGSLKVSSPFALFPAYTAELWSSL